MFSHSISMTQNSPSWINEYLQNQAVSFIDKYIYCNDQKKIKNIGNQYVCQWLSRVTLWFYPWILYQKSLSIDVLCSLSLS